jgi:hypothetical protein
LRKEETVPYNDICFLFVASDLISHHFQQEKERFMKTSLTLLAAAMPVLAFVQAADAQCGCQPTVSYSAPVSTTAYYAAPVTTYYTPTTTYYAPTTASYPAPAYYAPTTAYYGGGSYYGGYYRGGLFGTGLFGWAGVRGIDRRFDRRYNRRNPVTIQPY